MSLLLPFSVCLWLFVDIYTHTYEYKVSVPLNEMSIHHLTSPRPRNKPRAAPPKPLYPFQSLFPWLPFNFIYNFGEGKFSKLCVLLFWEFFHYFCTYKIFLDLEIKWIVTHIFYSISNGLFLYGALYRNLHLCKKWMRTSIKLFCQKANLTRSFVSGWAPREEVNQLHRSPDPTAQESQFQLKEKRETSLKY